MYRLLIILFLMYFYISCEDITPKPKAYLRLSYPTSEYIDYQSDCPYEIQVNKRAMVVEKKKCNLELRYRGMKATVYFNYNRIEDNLKLLLEDAQKFTYEHVVKAQGISEQAYQDVENRVFGMLYNVGGDAASQTQFYLTDSIRNFISGSLYFYAEPNYDSILPALKYINKDINKLIESIRWKSSK